MPNPTLYQITRNTILLENRNSSVLKRMSYADRNFDLFAEWLEKHAIHIPICQWSSVSALEDATRCTIANVRLGKILGHAPCRVRLARANSPWRHAAE
jgi:hypothetical protein